MSNTSNTQSSRRQLEDELSALILPMMWQMRQDAVRAFEPLGLRPVRALLLGFIAQGLNHPKDISDVMDTVPPVISSQLKELEDKGLVTRQLDPDDRRRVRLALTEEGSALNEQMRLRWQTVNAERLALFSLEELRQHRDAIEKMMETSTCPD